jgi:hypothetical protein
LEKRYTSNARLIPIPIQTCPCFTDILSNEVSQGRPSWN